MGFEIRKLELQDDALEEFRKLAAADKALAGRLYVFLQNLAGDQQALECLADDKYENTEFNVSGIKSWWRNAFVGWRIRALVAAPDYRMFYAAVGQTWVILGLAKRRSDLYEDHNLQLELRRRLNDYKSSLER